MYKKSLSAVPFIVFVFLLNASAALAQTADPSAGFVSPPPPPSGGSGASPTQPSGSFVQTPPFDPNHPPVPQGGQMPGTGIGGFDANRGSHGPGGMQGTQNQFQADPNRSNGERPRQFNDQNRQQFHGGEEDAGKFQQQQEQQQARMLKNAQNGLTQMQKMISGMEKRIASIEKKGGVVSAALKDSIGQAKNLMSKAQSASTMDEFHEAGLEDMRDLMDTINDEMQKAEMSTQFPAMVKQANRALTQQKKPLATARKRAASLKVNVESLLASWQAAVDAMSEGITKAQQSFKAGDTEEAVEALKDAVFDVMQTVDEYRQTFDMIANSQKMLAFATRELASIEKKLAALKKQGKDTSDADSALVLAKQTIQAVKDAIARSGIDPETLISTIEDAQDAKEELYSAMYDLTGLAQYNQPFQQMVPGLNMQQFQIPPGMQRFFGEPQQREQQQGEDRQGGFQQPGNSGALPRPAGSEGAPSRENHGGGFQQTPGTSGGGFPFFGPQSLDTTASSSLIASVLESIRKQVAELQIRIQGRTQ